MLIVLVRVVFVVLGTLIGLTSGKYFYEPLFGSGLPQWFGGAIGFGVAVTLIAAEQAFRRYFTRSLVAFLIGLAGGLALSALLLVVLRLVLQDEELYRNLDMPLTLVCTYLVMITVLHGADRLRVIVPFVEFRAERSEGAGVAVLDPQALGDARVPALLRAGVMPMRLLVHRQALMHWQRRLAEGDAVERARARRALDGIAALRAPDLPPLDIDETEIPHARDLNDVIIRLARLEGARILAVDRDLVQQARAEGLRVLDLAAIAAAMAPVYAPGTALQVLIERRGEERDQGIGYLDDGAMVVVAGAAERIGKRVTAVVRRLHHTANGRMIFADCLEQRQAGAAASEQSATNASAG